MHEYFAWVYLQTHLHNFLTSETKRVKLTSLNRLLSH